MGQNTLRSSSTGLDPRTARELRSRGVDVPEFKPRGDIRLPSEEPVRPFLPNGQGGMQELMQLLGLDKHPEEPRSLVSPARPVATDDASMLMPRSSPVSPRFHEAPEPRAQVRTPVASPTRATARQVGSESISIAPSAQPVDAMESLRTLLRVKTPSHVAGGEDPFVARRHSEIASGLDEWLPDADSPDYKIAQMGIGQQTGWSPARADMRSSDMSKLRQTLGIGQVEHEQGLERATAPARIAGEFNLRGRELANQGAMDIERERGRTMTERDERYYDYLDDADIDPTRISRGGVSVSTGRGRSVSPPTQGQTKALSDARSSYGGGFNKFRRMLGMGDPGREDYLNALNDVLVRSGSYEGISQLAQLAQSEGMSGSDAIAEAAAQGVQLDPYEQEFLILMLGE